MSGDGDDPLVLVADDDEDVRELVVFRLARAGYEVTERLRASDELADVAILLLTASVEEAAVEKGFAAGADDYIRKPFSPAELVERVAAALDSA